MLEGRIDERSKRGRQAAQGVVRIAPRNCCGRGGARAWRGGRATGGGKKGTVVREDGADV